VAYFQLRRTVARWRDEEHGRHAGEARAQGAEPAGALGS
jgi:hypothetical protein